MAYFQVRTVSFKECRYPLDFFPFFISKKSQVVDQTLKQLPEFNADEAASRQLKDRFNVVEAMRFFFLVSLTSMKKQHIDGCFR